MACKIVNSNVLELVNISIVMCHVIKLYMQSGQEQNNGYLNQCISIITMSVGAITTIMTTTGTWFDNLFVLFKFSIALRLLRLFWLDSVGAVEFTYFHCLNFLLYSFLAQYMHVKAG